MGSEDGEKMCFNAAKSYQSTWYNNGNSNPETGASVFILTEVNSWFDGATQIVPVKVTGTGETPLYFMLTVDGDINTGFTSSAADFVNKVNIVEQEDLVQSYGQQSWTVAQLGAGETYTKSNWASTGNTLTIAICSIDLGSSNTAKVIVYLDGTNSVTCSSDTVAPTVAPTYTPCSSSESEVIVSVTTDDYPDEYAWTIESSSGATIESEAFTANYTTYTDRYCMDSTICHTFNFTDSYGDGLGSGGFSLTVDGEVLLSDDEEEFSFKSADFGSCSGSTPAPTPSPTASPTESPTTSSTDCADTPFRFRLTKNGNNISRGCVWVANKDTKNRCNLGGVSSMCPSTCGTCSTCIDGANRFRFPWNGNMISRGCTWVANKATKWRCSTVTGMTDTCRSTCGSC